MQEMTFAPRYAARRTGHLRTLFEGLVEEVLFSLEGAALEMEFDLIFILDFGVASGMRCGSVSQRLCNSARARTQTETRDRTLLFQELFILILSTFVHFRQCRLACVAVPNLAVCAPEQSGEVGPNFKVWAVRAVDNCLAG